MKHTQLYPKQQCYPKQSDDMIRSQALRMQIDVTLTARHFPSTSVLLAAAVTVFQLKGPMGKSVMHEIVRRLCSPLIKTLELISNGVYLDYILNHLSREGILWVSNGLLRGK